MLNGGSMIWGFCVYFVYMIPLETDVLRKHRFQKRQKQKKQEIALQLLLLLFAVCAYVCENKAIL